MSTYTFVDETSNRSALVPYTAFAPATDRWPPTAVYLPRKQHSLETRMVDVLLWFHGFYVTDVKDLVRPVEAGYDMNLRESVRDANRDVILVAPYLGLSRAMSLGPLANEKGCQVFLDMVLDGVNRYQKTLTASAPIKLDLRHLIIAGHSAGGAMMKGAMKTLGDYQANLKECWGFDCFYDSGWPAWAKDNPTPKKYLYVANGSGDFGSYAFTFMRSHYGTPRKPVAAMDRIANTYLAPAVDRVSTGNDRIAFQDLVVDPDDWGIGRDATSEVRRTTDQHLGSTQSAYWGQLRPKLSGHFQVVRNLLTPRLQNSSFLRSKD